MKAEQPDLKSGQLLHDDLIIDLSEEGARRRHTYEKTDKDLVEDLLLIMLYKEVDFDHKSFYSKFYYMGDKVSWILGTAFLNEEGRAYVEKELKDCID